MFPLPSVKAIWNCLLDFFQNGCSFQASCSVALLFSSSIVLLLYYDAFSFDKFIDSHDLLLPLSHNNRYPYVTGTSVIALKYKDGVIMACDTGGWSQFLAQRNTIISMGNLILCSLCSLLWINFEIQECGTH
jgi:hypothetical protein